MQFVMRFWMVALMIVGAGWVQGQEMVAHRGASHDAPENTLAAFQLAWQQQADAIEGDFYLTTDGKIVCIHDKDTGRVAPGATARVVTESTLAELQGLDVGSWKGSAFADQRLPTLADVLAIVPEGKRIFVEIKCGPEILPALQKQLETSGLQPDQIMLIAFNADVIRQARQRMPQYKANWLTSYKQAKGSNVWRPELSTVLATLKSTGATGLGTKGNAEVVDKEFVRAIREAGFEFHVWTINDVEDARHWQTLGVDSITTDRPAYLRKHLGL